MQNVQNKGQIQNRYMRSSFLPKYQPKIMEISAQPSNKLNSLRIDKKTVRRDGISICLLTYVLFLIAHYSSVYKETKWFEIAAFFQTLFSEWKPYMNKIVCKKWFCFNKKK